MSALAAWTHPPTAIVAGGASGVGRAMAERLAVEGATVAGEIS